MYFWLYKFSILLNLQRDGTYLQLLVVTHGNREVNKFYLLLQYSTIIYTSSLSRYHPPRLIVKWGNRTRSNMSGKRKECYKTVKMRYWPTSFTLYILSCSMLISKVEYAKMVHITVTWIALSYNTFNWRDTLQLFWGSERNAKWKWNYLQKLKSASVSMLLRWMDGKWQWTKVKKCGISRCHDLHNRSSFKYQIILFNKATMF